MFKKQHTTKPNNHLLSNSAKRKIALPNAHSLAHATTHTQQQITIYYDQHQQPIYFATRSTDLLVPSIYTLLNQPNLLPIIRTHQHILDKLTQGADLMLPGLIKPELLPLSHLKKDQLVAIASHQPNDPIWAVGYLAQDISLLLQADSGKAVITLHTQNDSLWNAGNKQVPTPTVPLEPLIETQEPPASSSAAAALVEETPKPVHSPDAVDKPPSTHVDQFLLSALLITLWKKGHTLQSLLPMPASLFYSDHILPARPLECPKPVGVKDSSAKNLAKWLKQMQKKDLLSIKEDRKGGETMITSLNCDHPELEKFVTFRTIADQEKMEAKAQHGDEAGEDAAAKKPPSSYAASWNLPETTLSQLFRAKKDPAAVAAWMDMVDLDHEELYTRQTIKDALIKYLDAQVPPPAPGSKPINRALVVPDASLTAVMGLPGPASEPVSRNNLLDTILDRAFDPWWRLERDGVFVFEKKGEMPTIVLKMKKRAGPKHATLIAGLELFGIEPVRLAKELRSLIAGSTTTHPLPPGHPTAIALASKELRDKLAAHWGPAPPRPSPLELECQGDQRAFLQNLLTQSFRIHKSFISVP